MTVTACKVGELADGDATTVKAGRVTVAVFRQGNDYFAINDCCPHAGASLAAGFVENGVVACPWHFWRFRIADGCWADNPRIRTDSYPVTVEAGEVRVTVPDAATE